MSINLHLFKRIFYGINTCFFLMSSRLQLKIKIASLQYANNNKMYSVCSYNYSTQCLQKKVHNSKVNGCQ